MIKNALNNFDEFGTAFDICQIVICDIFCCKFNFIHKTALLNVHNFFKKIIISKNNISSIHIFKSKFFFLKSNG